ncbi:MAG: hypothetical protein ACYC2E_13550 [Sulfuricella sp.]
MGKEGAGGLVAIQVLTDDGVVEVFGKAVLHEVVVGDGNIDQSLAECAVFEVGAVLGELVDVAGEAG